MNCELTGHEMYEAYVGQITPDEFVRPFGGSVDAAIHQLLEEAWWESAGEDSPPSGFAEVIAQYAISKLRG